MIEKFLANALAPYIISLVVFLAGAAVGGASAWDWANSRADKEIASLKATHQQAMIDGLRDAELMRDGAQLRGDALAIQLANTRNDLAELNRQLSRNVPRVTTIYRPAPNAAPQPLPACLFTTGFVRNWNAALGVSGLQAAQTTSDFTDPASQSGATDGIDGTDLNPADINQADLLTNHIDNATRCQGIEKQLNLLIDWHEGNVP
jgi:hypothetical protein